MLALITSFAGIDQSTVLFDICCGTGAIGLCLSREAKQVIGVELIEQAVENAKENVKVNSESLDGDKTVCLRVSDHHPPSLLTFVGVEGSNNWPCHLSGRVYIQYQYNHILKKDIKIRLQKFLLT